MTDSLNEIRNLLTAQASAEGILLNSSLPEKDKEDFVTTLANVLNLSLDILRNVFNLTEDQVMALLILVVIRIMRITEDK